MRSVWLIGAAAVIGVATGPVFAADMPMFKAPPPYVDNWSGFYVGIEGGGMGGDTYITHGSGDPVYSNFPGVSEVAPYNIKGGFAGAMAGYNVLWGSAFLLGVEADYSLSWAKGTQPDIAPLTRVVSPFGVNDTVNIRSFGTLRARLGAMAFPDFLVYVTGGGAAAIESLEQDIASPTFSPNPGATAATGGPLNPTIPGASASIAQTRDLWGWTVGAGAEYRFAPNYTLRLEYLFADFGPSTFISPAMAASQTPFIFLANNQVKNEQNIVRVGVTGKLDFSFLTGR